MQQLRHFIKQISPITTDIVLDFIVPKFAIQTIAKDKFFVKPLQTCSIFAIPKFWVEVARTNFSKNH
jgi:hypothetical protein